jgi:RimJ/RimL family protein N-acetyltransferase
MVWARQGVGPYVDLDHQRVIGSTGLDMDTQWCAMTGFALCRDVWGCGLATEIAGAMVGLAESLHLSQLYALCHLDNGASARVLAKSGFRREGVLRRHTVFPNTAVDEPQDVECWSRVRII